MSASKYTVKTDFGLFSITKETSTQYEHLHVGGRKYCVEFRWNRGSPQSIVNLQWIDVAQGGCELQEKQIRKDDTIKLFDLSVTLLKQYNPEVKKIDLLDNSKFSCDLPRGKKGQIFMNYYNYLFHNATWYDSKLGAYPIDSVDKERYEKNKYIATDPSKKASMFDFKNTDLNTLLTPLYNESHTWREFLDKLYLEYKDKNLCGILYPWYLEVSVFLAGGLSLPSLWYIDVDLRPSIDYEITTHVGGKRRTRKRRSTIDEEDISSSEIRSLPFI